MQLVSKLSNFTMNLENIDYETLFSSRKSYDDLWLQT